MSSPQRFNYRIAFFLLFFTVATSCKTQSAAVFGVENKDDYFSIAVIPDTQYYTAERFGGTMTMFEDQITWIRKNQNKEKIEYVVHLGDVTDNNSPEEWERSKNVLYKLEADNIPYGVAVGNHDEKPNERFVFGDANTLYTRYFGYEHFKEKKWYGGAFEKNGNSDNHFDLFSANGHDFLVMYFGYNERNRLVKVHDTLYERKVFMWADSVLNAHPNRKAILVSHSILNRTKTTESHFKPGTGDNRTTPDFTLQGKAIYNMAKKHPNCFLMLSGHIAGEGFRRDHFNGNIIKTYLADYQQRQKAPYNDYKKRDGGNGLMRLMRFNLTKQTLSVVTFAPRANGQMITETDADSQFTEPLYE